MKEIKSDKLISTILILSIAVIICGIVLVKIYLDNRIGDTKNYEILVYEDGSATVTVDDVCHIQQLEDGTLIIAGGSQPQGFNYPRRESVTEEQ